MINVQFISIIIDRHFTEIQNNIIYYIVFRYMSKIKRGNKQGDMCHHVGAIGCSHKSVKLRWRCRQLLSAFLANGHLAGMSHQSRRLTNDKGDNDMRPGAMHSSPGIYLTSKENPG